MLSHKLHVASDLFFASIVLLLFSYIHFVAFPYSIVLSISRWFHVTAMQATSTYIACLSCAFFISFLSTFFFTMFTLKTVIYHLFSHSLILCNFFSVTLQKKKKKKKKKEIVGGYFSLSRLQPHSITHPHSMTLCNIIYESVVEGRKKYVQEMLGMSRIGCRKRIEINVRKKCTL